jgi:hypothetical protein
MTQIDLGTCQKIHTRCIDMATYVFEEDAVIVEGRLKDDRLFESHFSSGKVMPPGVVHHMIIRLKVRGPALVIEDVDVEMPTVPDEMCLDTRRSLEPIKGISIVAGFTLKVKELVGGVKGCAHLVALLTAMGPAAVQGAWSAATRRPGDASALMAYGLERIKDTCRVWRADGPAYAKLSAVESP